MRSINLTLAAIALWTLDPTARAASSPFLPPQCLAGEEHNVFSLEALRPHPEGLADLGFTPSPFFEIWKPGKQINVRLDVCLGGDAARLARLYLRPFEYVPGRWVGPGEREMVPVTYVYNLIDAANPSFTIAAEPGVETGYRIHNAPAADARIEGLAGALFGDYARLTIVLPLPDGREIVVEGRPPQTRQIAVAYLLDRTAASPGPVRGSLLASRVVYGHPFGDCPPDTRIGEERWRLGSAEIALDYCVRAGFGGNGSAWHQEYIALTLSDDNMALASSRPYKITLKGREAMDSHFHYHSDQHHHFDDAWHFKSDRLELALGCLDRLPGVVAPQGFQCAGVPRDNAVFAVRYGNGAWQYGEAKRGE